MVKLRQREIAPRQTVGEERTQSLDLGLSDFRLCAPNHYTMRHEPVNGGPWALSLDSGAMEAR